MAVSSPSLARCDVRFLGTVPYLEAWDLQRSLGEQRVAGEIPDTMLLLEHPHTYTLGRTGDPTNILLSEAELAERGAQVINVDRGGDVTYHGPGQLVGYPIMLVGEGWDVLRYIRMLEEVIIRVLAKYDIEAGQIDGLTGVWIGDEKIAAIGVKKGRVTSHGFALNISTDLSYFEHIIPCGIKDKGVTSMERVLKSPAPANVSRTPTQYVGQRRGELHSPSPEIEDVAPVVAMCFGDVFEREIAFEAK